jgi:hypothetical protein
VAAHLAATHAGQGKRTLLIDGDLRRPSVHRLYQVPNSVGLSNVLLQQISWRDALVRMPEPAGLDILPAGPSWRARINRHRIGRIGGRSAREYDLVVLDAPLLVCRAVAADGERRGWRHRDGRAGLQPDNASSVIARQPAGDLVGVVLNEVHREIGPGYYYSYYNRYLKYYAERSSATPSALACLNTCSQDCIPRWNAGDALALCAHTLTASPRFPVSGRNSRQSLIRRFSRSSAQSSLGSDPE